MNTENYLNTVQTIFEQELATYIKQYVERTTNNVVDLALQQRLDFPDMAEQFKPSPTLYYNLYNDSNSWKLVFIFNDGTNLDGIHYNSIGFLIESTDPDNRNFSIQEYFKHFQLDFSASEFFTFENEEQALKELKVYLKHIVQLLEQKNMKALLESNKWIEVPADMSMYR